MPACLCCLLGVYFLVCLCGLDMVIGLGVWVWWGCLIGSLLLWIYEFVFCCDWLLVFVLLMLFLLLACCCFTSVMVCVWVWWFC